MKLLIFLFFISFGGQAHAHSNHHHSNQKVSEATIKSNAQKRIGILIEKKKLSSIWRKAKLLSSEKKRFKGRVEWLIKFENVMTADASKKVLYMFFNINGDFLAANFTGK